LRDRQFSRHPPSVLMTNPCKKTGSRSCLLSLWYTTGHAAGYVSM